MQDEECDLRFRAGWGQPREGRQTQQAFIQDFACGVRGCCTHLQNLEDAHGNVTCHRLTLDHTISTGKLSCALCQSLQLHRLQSQRVVHTWIQTWCLRRNNRGSQLPLLRQTQQPMQTKQPNEVSWTQELPKTSLDFVHSFNLPKTAKIIDVGGGDSKLVDYLLDEILLHHSQSN